MRDSFFRNGEHAATGKQALKYFETMITDIPNATIQKKGPICVSWIVWVFMFWFDRPHVIFVVDWALRTNYLLINLSICLSIYLSIYLSIHPPIHPSTHPSIHPSIYLSIYLSVCVLAGNVRQA